MPAALTRLPSLTLRQAPSPDEVMASGSDAAHIIFRCSDELAAHVVDIWHLPASAAELTELPADTAIARLPGMIVALKASDR